MGLKDVLDAVDAQLPATWTILTGTNDIPVESNPPRLVWVAMPESYTVPLKMTQGYPGALWTRRCVVEAHLWGSAKDGAGVDNPIADMRSEMAAVEGMIATLVEALHGLYTVGGCVLEGAGTWYTGGLVTYGLGYVLPVTFLVPVVRAVAAGGVKTLQAVRAQTQITDGAGGAPENGPLILEP